MRPLPYVSFFNTIATHKLSTSLHEIANFQGTFSKTTHNIKKSILYFYEKKILLHFTGEKISEHNQPKQVRRNIRKTLKENRV